MKKSSKEDLQKMKVALSKKDWAAFDQHRTAILSRYSVGPSCTFDILTTLNERMPEGEAQEYSRLVYEAAVEDVRNIHRKAKI